MSGLNCLELPLPAGQLLGLDAPCAVRAHLHAAQLSAGSGTQHDPGSRVPDPCNFGRWDVSFFLDLVVITGFADTTRKLRDADAADTDRPGALCVAVTLWAAIFSLRETTLKAPDELTVAAPNTVPVLVRTETDAPAVPLPRMVGRLLVMYAFGAEIHGADDATGDVGGPAPMSASLTASMIGVVGVPPLPAAPCSAVTI